MTKYFQLLISTRVQLFIIVFLTFLVYSNIFQNEFVIDDKTFIVNWQEIRSLSNIPNFFEGNVPAGHEGVYRPVRSVLYAIYYQIFGTNIFGYHLHSLLIHLAVTVLVYFIVRELVISIKYKSIKQSLAASPLSKKKSSILNTQYSIPFISALLFGLHPIHTETITYISSSMDVWGIVFFFTAFYLFISHTRSHLARLNSKYVGSVVFAILAFFTNEVTLILPLLVVFYELCFTRWKEVKKRIWWFAPFFAGAGFYAIIRFFILHSPQRAPYPADSIYLNVLTMVKVFVKYLSLLFFPVNQANNHTIWGGIEAFIYRGYNPDPIKAQTIFSPSILISFIILAIVIFLAVKVRNKFPIITFGIGWFFISLLPVSEIIPQGSILGERFLYIPSFGFVLIAGYLIHKIFNFQFSIFNQFSNSKFTIKNYLPACILLLVSCYLFLTYQRNKDWHDEITFWRHDINIYPNTNAYAYFQIANQYKEKKDYALAIENYDKSFQINPHFAVAIASSGLVYEENNETEKAIVTYKKATEADPLFWEGYLKLGKIYEHLGKYELAKDEYLKLLKIYPDLYDIKIIIYNLDTKIKQQLR